MGVIIKVRREEGSQRDLMDQASWDTVALPTSEQEVGTQSPQGCGLELRVSSMEGVKGRRVPNMKDQSSLEIGLTRMPSNRDRARSGLRARRVRRALMDAISEYCSNFAIRLVSEI